MILYFTGLPVLYEAGVISALIYAFSPVYIVLFPRKLMDTSAGSTVCFSPSSTFILKVIALSVYFVLPSQGVAVTSASPAFFPLSMPRLLILQTDLSPTTAHFMVSVVALSGLALSLMLSPFFTTITSLTEASSFPVCCFTV